MRPLIFHNALAAVLFWASLVLWFAIEGAVKARTESHGRTNSEWTVRFIPVLLVASIASSLVLAGRRVMLFPDPAWWPVLVGLTVVWAGMAFRQWSILTLGRFFKVTVVIQNDHRVIDSGPYRWLRHPSYLGYIVGMTGIGIAEGGWASATIMLVGPLLAFLVRIKVEERVLKRELGEEYTAYARRTSRLIPGVF